MVEHYTDHESMTLLRDFNQTHTQHTWSVFVHEGPPHQPTFKICLYLNNARFEGCGSSKKSAKIDAIKKFYTTNCTVVNIKTEDNKRPYSENCMESPPLKKISLDTNIPVSQTSAISILHEIFPGQTLVYGHEQPHGLLETISVNVAGTKYIGYGKNKKEAKEIACRNALKSLYETLPTDNKFKDQIEMLRTDYHEAKIIDRFAFITDDIYQNIKFDNIAHKEYSVIASIIQVNKLLDNCFTFILTYFCIVYLQMTKNDEDSAQVICLATGTKCLSGNHLSLCGESLHDCHAEILTRRCLIKYFYKQLVECVKKNPSIFIEDHKEKKFKLSKDVTFHLYINTAPCGESRIFSFTDSVHHNNRLNRGLLRSKIENGAGTVAVFGREMQTFDGIAQGERLVTMSCSDKLTRWNVLGLQGNLLSNLIDPIYLDSMSIGSVFNIDHMKRTIYGRIENVINNLPQCYE